MADSFLKKRRKRNFILVLIVFFFSINSNLFAQNNIRIPLVRKLEKGVFNPIRGFGEYIKDYGSFKFDSTQFSLFSIWKFGFDESQRYYNRFISRNRNDSSFLMLQGRYGWDTTQILPSFDNSTYVLAGLKLNGQYVIITDINANKIFFDEREYTYRLTKVPKDSISILTDQLPIIKFPINLSLKGKKIKRSIAVQFIPKAYFGSFKVSYSPKVADSLIFVSTIHEYLEGKISIGQRKRTMLVRNFNHDVRYNNKESVKFYLLPESGTVVGDIKEYSFFKLGDTIPINNDLYKLKEIDPLGSYVDISYVGKNNNIGIEPGFLAKYFSFNNLIDKRQISLDDYKGNYLLIDFWGTWCGPCKEILPSIKSMANNYKNKNFKVLSIAYDENVSIVRKFIQSEQMFWDNHFEPFGNTNQSSIINNYKVQSYPTTILIDPAGKIIYRATNIYEFENIKKYIESLYK